MRLLVVEDSIRLREGIEKALNQSGYAVDVASDGEEGLWACEDGAYDAIILDIMLPKLDGLQLLEKLRSDENTTPVLLLTAKDTVDDRVKGLRMGADDYLVKPFALEELLARIEALCRRAYKSTSNNIEIGDFTIDTLQRRVCFRDCDIPLPAREFALLEYLARRKDELVTRGEIENHIYDSQVDPMSNVVDAAIYALRKKMSKAGAPAMIQTRRGFGYILTEQSP